MKRMLQAAVILSVLLGSTAMADGRDRHDRDRDRNDRHSHQWRGDDRHDGRHDWRDHRGRHWVGPYHRPPGYYAHRWRRGEHLPHAFRGRTYIVHEYHRYHLRRPPRGYHWVRVDRDVILAAIATGIILDVAYNHFH